MMRLQKMSQGTGLLVNLEEDLGTSCFSGRNKLQFVKIFSGAHTKRRKKKRRAAMADGGNWYRGIGKLDETVQHCWDDKPMEAIPPFADFVDKGNPSQQPGQSRLNTGLFWDPTY